MTRLYRMKNMRLKMHNIQRLTTMMPMLTHTIRSNTTFWDPP
jgi:hypothetical protein